MLRISLISVILGFWLIGFALVAEIWARWKFGTVCTEPHPIFHHRFIPKRNCLTRDPEFSTKYQINSLGLRNREVIVLKPDDLLRILIVGDSLTQGAGVSQDRTFNVRLENLLTATGKKVEVINAGLSANSPIIIYLWLRELGLSLQPDLVIMTVNESDFSEEQKYDSIKITNADGSVRAVPGRPLSYLPRSVSKWLQRHSSFYTFFNARIMSRIISWKANLKSKNITNGGVNNYQGGVAAGGAYAISRGVSNDKYISLWVLVAKNLLLTIDLLRDKQIPFILVIQPHAHEVSATAWPGRVQQGLLMNKIYTPKFYDSFINIGKYHNFPVLDLRTAFMKDGGDDLFYANDGHWTAKGHEITAEAIGKFLISNNIF